jgi:ubiquinone/menaquinone biosynthesis C-methylase UbiE
VLNVFAERVIEPELLDHLPPEEARPNLADLTRINQYFGGHSVILKTLAQVTAPSDAFTLLDIGAASGDTAMAITAAYSHSCVVSFDYSPTNIGAAPHPKIIGNAFALPFAPSSFDFVLCSLFLHHFQDDHVVHLLRSFHAVAKRALLVCDLERNVIPYFFLPATKHILNWKKITVHDGMISVRAAFKQEELRALAEKAGISVCEITVHRPAFRISLIAKK